MGADFENMKNGGVIIKTHSSQRTLFKEISIKKYFNFGKLTACLQG
jgi:hypothetical protein